MNRQEVIQEVKKVMASNPLFLDTETTGIHSTDQIVEIGIVDAQGKVLLDTRIRPTIPIPPEATAIHGITDEDVTDAPSFLNVATGIGQYLVNQPCVIYNASFDLRMLMQSANAYAVSRGSFDPFLLPPYGHCAMRLYADFLHEGGKWQKLGNAARQCDIPIPERLHGAVVDAKLTRELMLFMAKQEETK